MLPESDTGLELNFRVNYPFNNLSCTFLHVRLWDRIWPKPYVTSRIHLFSIYHSIVILAVNKVVTNTINSLTKSYQAYSRQEKQVFKMKEKNVE